MALSTFTDIGKRMLEGKIAISLGISLTTTANTAAAAASGISSLALAGNTIGSTYPGTLAGFQQPPAMSGDYINVATIQVNPNSSRLSGFVRVYLAGTLNLTATGDQFTHNAATFPLLRTIYGAASQPVALIPILQLTTATSVTAPAFQIQTNAGGAGYVNQNGTSVIGTKTFTFPAAATATGSCFFLRLNDGDYAARDITQIKVTTASSTGAANIWLMEHIGDAQSTLGAISYYDPIMDGGLRAATLTPAVATSGTASSSLLLSNANSASAFTGIILNIGVLS